MSDARSGSDGSATIEYPCPNCYGTGKLSEKARPVQEVIENCTRPGATANERDAAAWLQALTQEARAS